MREIIFSARRYGDEGGNFPTLQTFESFLEAKTLDELVVLSGATGFSMRRRAWNFWKRRAALA